MSNLLVIFRPRWRFETQDFVDYSTLVNPLHRTLEIIDMLLVMIIATDTYVESVRGEILRFATIRCGLPGQPAFSEVMDGSAD